jgi:hypothetical protein
MSHLSARTTIVVGASAAWAAGSPNRTEMSESTRILTTHAARGSGS